MGGLSKPAWPIKKKIKFDIEIKKQGRRCQTRGFCATQDDSNSILNSTVLLTHTSSRVTLIV